MKTRSNNSANAHKPDDIKLNKFRPSNKEQMNQCCRDKTGNPQRNNQINAKKTTGK